MLESLAIACRCFPYPAVTSDTLALTVIVALDVLRILQAVVIRLGQVDVDMAIEVRFEWIEFRVRAEHKNA